MQRTKFLPILVVMAMLALPVAAGALSLDVEAKAGGGLALGTTDNPNATGEARAAAGGGVGLDLYLVKVGPVDLGISVGAEISYLTFHGVWNIPANQLPGSLATTQTTENSYTYLNFPISIVGRVPVGDAVSITARAGGFIGRFLSGSSNITYSVQQAPYGLVNGTQTLDTTNTEPFEYGLHFTGGADIAISHGLALSPAIQFDMGLTDTSVNNPLSSYKDTFWSLTALIGIKYNVF